MSGVCPRCGGMGARVTSLPGGGSKIETCECQLEMRLTRLLEHAGIPKRYEHCSLESYDASFHGANKSLASALITARKFVDGYPVTTEGKGLLFTGNIGVGKTHLSAAILRALILEKGVHGLFRDYRELLKDIQHSYNPQALTTEKQVLNPVFDAEVLVLDELGAARPSDWIWDIVALILNNRYSTKRTTIITTNLQDLPGAGKEPVGFSDADMAERARRAAKDPTLGDRIGDSMRSRLAEMCVTVRMEGQDFRQNVARARFG